MENNTSVVPKKEDVYTDVMHQVAELREQGTLALPAGFSPGNAIKYAQLEIAKVKDRSQKPALEVCTRGSIARALLDTILQGLNPGKNQCYYIVYGDQLVMQRSWFGEARLAKSVCPDIENIYSDVVYKGDVFEYSKKRGCTVVEKHQQTLDNIGGEIIAAYCTIIFKDGHEETTIMTIGEIHSSWKMSRQSPFDDHGNLKAGSTHAKSPAEMAKRTVVRRACKPIINSSDDSNLLMSINRTDDAVSDSETDAMIDENNGILDVDINGIDIDKSTGEVIEPTVSEAAPY